MTAYATLADLRTRMFGYSLAFAAREARIDEARLGQIETDQAPTVAEIERLAEIYGLDGDTLAELPIEVPARDAITALSLLTEFREISAGSKRQLVLAASAARDVVDLRELLRRPRGYDALHARHHPPAPKPELSPYRQGAHFAQEWRSALGMGNGPIPSVRDFVQGAFPEVAILFVDFGNDDLSGVCFLDAVRGPAIVLNASGKNENPLVRRFSLLHELGHLLFDATRGVPLAAISGFHLDRQRVVEQRANAFAIRFLCPYAKLQELAERHSASDASARLQQTWGLHYAAAKHDLDMYGVDATTEAPPEGQLAYGVLPKWLEAEDWALGRFPLESVPLHRRTNVARLAARAYSRDCFGRDRFARYLAVTPAEDVERVVHFYGLELPDA